jgi:hypothetical protein
MPTCSNRLPQRDSNQIASGVTGAVQSQRADLFQPVSLPCPKFGRAVFQSD